MAHRSGASILQRFEALPIIIVFALLIALFMYAAPEVFLAPYIYTTFLSTLPPLILLATVIEQTMAAANDSPAAMRNANRRHLDLLLRRLSFNRRDARRVMGVFRRILWRLQHQSGTR